MSHVSDTITALLRRRRQAVAGPRNQDHGDLLIMAEGGRCVWVRNPAGGPILDSGPVMLTLHDPGTHKLVDVVLTEAERQTLDAAIRVAEQTPREDLPTPAPGSRRARRHAESGRGESAPAGGASRARVDF